MDSKDASLVVTVGLLILSESLPFLRRQFKTKLPLDGILFAIFAALYLSKCIDEDCAQRAESVIGRDITGDGIIGIPQSKQEDASAVRLSAGGGGVGSGGAAVVSSPAIDHAEAGDPAGDTERTSSETRRQ